MYMGIIVLQSESVWYVRGIIVLQSVSVECVQAHYCTAVSVGYVQGHYCTAVGVGVVCTRALSYCSVCQCSMYRGIIVL